jgi:hypothetical protein
VSGWSIAWFLLWLCIAYSSLCHTLHLRTSSMERRITSGAQRRRGEAMLATPPAVLRALEQGHSVCGALSWRLSPSPHTCLYSPGRGLCWASYRCYSVSQAATCQCRQAGRLPMTPCVLQTPQRCGLVPGRGKLCTISYHTQPLWPRSAWRGAFGMFLWPCNMPLGKSASGCVCVTWDDRRDTKLAIAELIMACWDTASADLYDVRPPVRT